MARLSCADIPLGPDSGQKPYFFFAHRRAVSTCFAWFLGVSLICVILKRDVMPKLKKTGLLDQVEFVYLDFDQNRTLVSQMMVNEMIPEMILYRKTASGWTRSNLNMSEKLEEIQAFIKAGLRTPKLQTPKPKTPKPETPKPETVENPQDENPQDENPKKE